MIRSAIALLCLCGAIVKPNATAQVAPPAPAADSGRTAVELLNAGEASYNRGDFAAAAAAFQEFIVNFGGIEGTGKALEKVKPLLAICLVRETRFEEAVPLLDEALKLPGLDATRRADLLFFHGLATLRTGNFESSRASLGAVFTDKTIETSRRMESLILGGMTYVMEKNWEQTILFFQKHGGEIRSHSPEAGARAEIFLLHALMQAGKWDEAAQVATAIHADLNQVRQVVTFSSLLIEIGGHFLESGESHKAIRILRLVPHKSEIERLQALRLAEAEAESAHVTRIGATARAAQLAAALSELKREVEAFAAMSGFESAVRLRLASAYSDLGRIREASLILDQMVRQMDPDPIVEAATANLMRGWMSLGRNRRSIRTADLYLERFSSLTDTPNKPDVMFLRGQAIEGEFRYQEAADAYAAVAEAFPDHAIATRAAFMQAYNILQMENYPVAETLFRQILDRIEPSDEMWRHVFFWRAMSLYFDQQWEPCREQLGTYLARAEKDDALGEYVDDARFRDAFTYFSEARYPEAIERLRSFVAGHPESEWLPEALLTLGDCCAAEGEIEEADRWYARIGVEAEGFHDEAWMKRGNLLKTKKDLDGMIAHYRRFLETRPTSPRIAEALHWIGWAEKSRGNGEEARKIYWDAIAKFGDDRARPGLEDIFLALGGFYPGAEKDSLEAKLAEARASAKVAAKPRAAVRYGWALGQVRLGRKPSPEASPEDPLAKQRRIHLLLAELAPEIDPKETSPRILADVGEAQLAVDDLAGARATLEGLRKWWPRAPERDRAHAGLGFLALREGNGAEALAQFDLFEKRAVMPKTAPDENGISLVEGETGGKVALAKAGLLATTDSGRALHLALAVQRTKSMPARVRADAFLLAARTLVAGGRYREALPYFEQIYILFNRFPETVAVAYFERAQALEKLHLPEKAREVYSELATRKDLADLTESAKARDRATALGGVLKSALPEGGLLPPRPAASVDPQAKTP